MCTRAPWELSLICRSELCRAYMELAREQRQERGRHLELDSPINGTSCLSCEGALVAVREPVLEEIGTTRSQLVSYQSRGPFF